MSQRSTKHLSFAGVKLITIAEGEISELHVGLKSTINALFLEDLKIKVKRGVEGRVRKGKSGGGLAFGYRVVKQLDSRGELVRGERSVDEAEASGAADFRGVCRREIAQSYCQIAERTRCARA